ncbi:MAG: iron-sulfur cluster repair di-iron protein [Polyangiaceae bacterium]|nr:iron-sulfur cluster repair di-iron protein [Polyangiaceae bacterium]
MIDIQRSVASLVLDHSECAPVLQHHGIDYCCRGHMSFEAACRERGLDPVEVARELVDAIARRTGDDGPDPRTLSTPALVGHIVAHHHEYLREAMPFVSGLAAKVASVHGASDPRLVELHALVTQLFAALEPHLADEEEKLFPALMSQSPERPVLARDLAAMLEEHRAVGALLQAMRAAADDYAWPEWACNSYRALFAELEALEGDVLRHVHLENHVLAPRFAEV